MQRKITMTTEIINSEFVDRRTGEIIEGGILLPKPEEYIIISKEK
jgi:hypothetical protein